MMTSPVLITRARLWGADPARSGGELVDLFLADGRVQAMAPSGHLSDHLVDHPGSGAGEGLVVDIDGRWLMPGLVDKHVHFTLWSKHRGRMDLSGVGSALQAVAAVTGALVDLEQAGTEPSVPLVARGFQDALWPDVPTAALLDDACAHVGQASRPVVLISHDLHSVWINSAAAHRFGVPAGLLREQSAFDVEIALEAEEAAQPRRVEALVADAVAAAAARGVTGVMDLEMADNPSVWVSRVASGLTAIRVEAGVYPQHLDRVLARDERTGRRVRGTSGLVTVGPLKVFADGALNTRTAWCFDPYPGTRDFGHSAHARGDLERILADARDVGFEVALHAIGDRAVTEALDAFERSGARGSIEHAQLIRDEDISRFVALKIAAGIQPEHALDDRHVTDKWWAGRTRRAFPYGSLAAAGVELRIGSDAPVAPLDPWIAISAAVHRTRDALEPWEPANALSLDQALRASWASPQVRQGATADVVVVDADPATLDAAALRAMPVALTVTAGRVTHLALS